MNGKTPDERVEGWAVPREGPGRLLLRFLRFGLLAWGGPVAQIAMIRQEIVEEEKWISRERFNRILAVYQALPGPEAHELCVHFGMLSGGRQGGILAGLGFMAPGLVLMFLLSALRAGFSRRRSGHSSWASSPLSLPSSFERSTASGSTRSPIGGSRRRHVVVHAGGAPATRSRARAAAQERP